MRNRLLGSVWEFPDRTLVVVLVLVLVLENKELSCLLWLSSFYLEPAEEVSAEAPDPDTQTVP